MSREFINPLQLPEVLYRGVFDTTKVDAAVEDLRMYGSRVSPKFYDPFGVIVYHQGADLCFKQTLYHDDVKIVPEKPLITQKMMDEVNH